VRDVFPDSPAEEAGIKSRDILLSINDRRVESNGQLMTALRQLPSDSEITIRLKRGDEYLVVKAKLVPAPATEPNQMLSALLTRLETYKARLNSIPTTDPTARPSKARSKLSARLCKG
jgi:predicted metalloprotease with PDZ domain